MIMIGNWKSNITSSGIRSWMSDYQSMPGMQQVVLAPHPYLKWMSEAFMSDADGLILGAQDVGVHAGQTVTGEVGVSMLSDSGVSLVCIGHSEMRRTQSPSDQQLADRVSMVSERGMIPLLCVSDIHEDESGYAWLKALPEMLPKELWIAYEPEWAIGQKDAASPDMVTEHVQVLDASLKKRYTDQADKICIRWMYGGAVNAGNIKALSSVKGLDGFLVGRASLESKDWRALVQCI